MGRKRVKGICKICGAIGKLSYEHVPPEKAFNNNRFYYEAELNKLIQLEDIDFIPQDLVSNKIARKKQGGIGNHTICSNCNNNTGSWYGSDYISWVYQSMAILQKAKGNPTLYYPTFFFPLRVIKQIITMFFSVNHENFRLNEQELVRFVLNKEDRYLNPKYKLYCYYNIVGQNRYVGNFVKGSLSSSSITQISEITFPPFGFVFTIDSAEKPDKRLVDITHFAKFRYNDWTDFYQKFSSLPTHLPYIPGDYRSKEEILSSIEDSKKYTFTDKSY